MNFPDTNEEVPTRSPFSVLGEVQEDKKVFTKDEEDASTLRRIYNMFSEKLNELDQFHLFTKEARALSDLKLKQQIEAHQLAYDILAPLHETMKQALTVVDERFRERNKQ